MDIMCMLPTIAIGIGEIKDGMFINAHSFCKNLNGIKKEKCINYYRDICKAEGIYTCPYGFNSYVFKKDDNIEVIFTSIKIRDNFDKGKLKGKIKKEDINIILSLKDINKSICIYEYSMKIIENCNYSNNFVKDVMHEIRNFNAKIITKSESVITSLDKKPKKIKGKLKNEENLLDNIFALSSLVEARFMAFDCTVNPSVLKLGEKTPLVCHKKFYKAKLCCQSDAKNKGLNIRICENTSRIPLYNSFDLVPFLLLDNAIKYSLDNSQIEIKFKDSKDELIITILSSGPYIDKDELNHVFEHGFRAKSVKNSKIGGSGIGLHLVKNIIDIHKGNIYVDFIKNKLNNNDYGEFIVKLCLPKE